MIHDSKRDPQLVSRLRRLERIALGAGTLLALGSLYLPLRFVVLVCAAAFLALALGIRWFLIATRYEITPSHLKIRAGATRLRIPLHNILELTPTRDRSNAPALSYERIRVDFSEGSKNKHVLISPADPAAFLQDLARREPRLRQFTGDWPPADALPP